MSDLWRFLFNGELDGPVFRYRRMKVSRKQGEQQPEPPPPSRAAENLKFRLVMFLSRTLAALLILCVLGMFGLLFLKQEVPQFLTLIVSGIMGYFGGAISAYLGFQKLRVGES